MIRIVSNLDIPITLVGNKSDLENRREVSNETAYNYAEENELTYIETSAKNNINIEKIFDETLRNIPEQTTLYIEDDTISLSNNVVMFFLFKIFFLKCSIIFLKFKIKLPD